MSRIAAVVAAALLSLTAGLSPAAATPPGGLVPGLPVHVALGDSVAAGAGAPPGQGYVPLLVEQLRDDLNCSPAAAATAADGCPRLQLANLSRGGATTTSLVADQLPMAVALLRSRNGDANPRNDVETISLTIGGNDVYGPVVSACIPTPTAACAVTVASSLNTAQRGLATILGTLRDAAGPSTRIAVMTYYNPLPGCHLAPFAALGDQVLEGGGGVPAGLNDIIRAAAAATGADVAETYGLVGPGELVGGRDCLHPNAIGHAEIAPVFAAALTG